MDLLRHIETFVRVAEAGSLSKAARSRRLSVAMTSRQLRALELHLGVELVHRSTRRMALTERGEALLPRARELLAQADAVVSTSRKARGVSGRLRVSAPASFALPNVAPLFAALLARHPRLELELRFEDHAVDLVGEGIDLALRAGNAPPDSPLLVARKVAVIDRVLCAAPSLLAAHGPIASVAQLPDVPCLVQGSASRWVFETDGDAVTVEVTGRLRTNSVLALREACIAGIGVARLPRWLADEALSDGRLVRLFPEHRLAPADVHGIYHRASRGSDAIRATLDFLVAELPLRTSMRAPGSPEPRPIREPRGRSSRTR